MVMLVGGKDGNGLDRTQGMGFDNEVLAAEIHGPYYTPAIRGKMFRASTAAAGVTIPASNATAAVFVIYNPAGSNKVVELVRINIGITAATLVVAPISLGISAPLIVAPTSVTEIAIKSAAIGGPGVSAIKAYSAATIVATTDFFHLFSVSATSGLGPNFNYGFQGELLIYPGSLVHLCGTAAQASPAAVTATWSEWTLPA